MKLGIVCWGVASIIFLLACNYFWQKLDLTYTKYDLVANSPHLPAITVCPPGGFDPVFLTTLGLNLSCQLQSDCLDNYATLRGVDFGSNESLWMAAILPLRRLISQANINGKKITDLERHWTVSNTVFGPCWTIRPQTSATKRNMLQFFKIHIKRQIPCSIVLRPFMEGHLRSVYHNCKDVANYCNTSCVFEKSWCTVYKMNHIREFAIMLHNSEDPPNISNRKAITTFSEEKTYSSIIEIIVSQKEITRKNRDKSCIENTTYTSNICYSLCNEDLVTNRECQLFSNYNNIENWDQVCTHNLFHARKQIFRYVDNVLQQNESCHKLCHPQCKNTEFFFDKIKRQNRMSLDEVQDHIITVKISENYVEEITEVNSHTIAQILANIGGSIGIILGIGIITLWTSLGRLAEMTLCKVFNSSEINSSKNNKFLNSHTLILWKYIGYIFCCWAFCIHLVLLINRYLQYDVVSSVRLSNTGETYPTLLLCPDAPFNIEKMNLNKSEVRSELIRKGICDSMYRCHRNDVVKYFINNLPGIWSKNESISSIWNNTKLSVDQILLKYRTELDTESDVWDYSLTAYGYCLTLHKNTLQGHTLFLRLNEYDPLKNLGLDFSLSDTNDFVYVLATDYTVSKLFVQMTNEKIYKSKETRGTYILSKTIQNRLSTYKNPCLDPPYVQILCVESCLIRETSDYTGCSMPYQRGATNLTLCHTQDQYENAIKTGALGLPIWLRTNSTKLLKCASSCKPECQSRAVHISSKLTSYREENEFITLTYAENSDRVIEESFILPLDKFIVEIVGIIGLYFGFSLTGVTSLVIYQSSNLRKYCKLKVNKAFTIIDKYGRLLIHIIRIISLLIVGYIVVLRLYRTIISPVLHTTYDRKTIIGTEYPSTTFCHWPPFNLYRLLDIGIDFDQDKYCYYAFIFYECDYDLLIDDFINFPNGFNNMTADQIWEAASWKLEEIVYSYHINSREILVGGELDSVYWSSRFTALGKCYTFKLSDDIHSIKAVHFTTMDYEAPEIEDSYQYSLRDSVTLSNGMMHDTVVYFHQRNDAPVYFYNNRHAELRSSERTALEFEFSLKRYSRLNLRTSSCVDDQAYSRNHCNEHCLIKVFSEKLNCRMPFQVIQEDDNVGNCSEDAYKLFPKFKKNVIVSDIGKSEKDACLSQCEESCISDNYEIKLESKLTIFSKHNYSSLITLRPTETYYELFEENIIGGVDEVISEIGGVISATLGESLISLLMLMISGLASFYQMIISTIFK